MEHHRQRLGEDHEQAQILAEGIRQTDGLALTPDTIDTNIVIFRVDPQLGTAAEFVGRLKEENVLALSTSPTQIRLVTHRDVTREQCQIVASLLPKIAARLAIESSK